MSAARMNATPPTREPLLRVNDVRTHFAIRRGRLAARSHVLKAVDGVSFELDCGRTLGLVGESGCGKSTLARTILGLIPATSGRVIFAGEDVFALPRHRLRPLRRRLQIVFQDPITSLNPKLRVGIIVGEALQVHGLVRTRSELRDRVAQVLTRVGLSPDDQDRYPHEFSGGQRQRIGLARALAIEPELLICDEPVSALDVSIQAQILNLLAELQHDLGLGYLFIAHDLAVVRHISDEVAVMYAGKIVEHAPTEELIQTPRHPYTRTLLAVARFSEAAAAPVRTDAWVHPVGAGSPQRANARDTPAGCAYHPRCPYAEPVCCVESPPLLAQDNRLTAHQVACHVAHRPPDAQDSPPAQ